MPRVSFIIAPEDTPTADNDTTRTPEAIRLYMPSDIQEDLRATYCDPVLLQMEADIRYACATEALQDLRRHLHLRVYMNQLKIKNVTGQKGNTRARGLQETIDRKVGDAADRYRVARRAYMALKGPEAPGMNKLRELKAGDVIGLGERAQRELMRRQDEALRKRVGRPVVPSTTTSSTGATTEPSGPPAPDATPLDLASSDRAIDTEDTRGRAAASGESRHKVSWIWTMGGLEDVEEEEAEGQELSVEMNDGKIALFTTANRADVPVSRRSC